MPDREPWRGMGEWGVPDREPLVGEWGVPDREPWRGMGEWGNGGDSGVWGQRRFVEGDVGDGGTLGMVAFGDSGTLGTVVFGDSGFWVQWDFGVSGVWGQWHLGDNDI